MTMIGMPDMKFTMTVSAYDCTGCGSCANVCPGKKGEKALVMANMEAECGRADILRLSEQRFRLSQKLLLSSKRIPLREASSNSHCLSSQVLVQVVVRHLTLNLITQLFGDRMYIANATGCSSIWGNSSPSTPYTVTPEGKGPAWSNSLFEDNAEFGYGMLLAQKALREGLKSKVETVAASEKASEEVKAACAEWLDTYSCGATNGTATDKLVAALRSLMRLRDMPGYSLRIKISLLRNHSGSSVVTDGLTISDSVVLTMYLQVVRTSTLWYSIQRYILTQVDSLLSLLRQVLLLSSQQAVKRLRRKTLLVLQ